METFRNTLRNKWTKHVTARRIRSLWTEYTKVAEIKDPSLMTIKLNHFLDSFQESYKDMLESGQIKSIDLDKIFGDCSDILVSLLDLVERESNRQAKKGSSADTNEDDVTLLVELINKSLGVAELILHDEKYKVVVKETPNLIYRILTLLDTLSTSENKKILLRIISAIGENPDNKLEIGRLEGFKKLLVLMHNDKELTREILKTIKHFLDVKQTSAASEEELLKLINMKKSLSMSSIGEFARHKIGTVVSEGFKVIVGEFQKVFSPNESDSMPRKLSIEKSIGVNEIVQNSFIPSAETIEQELRLLLGNINNSNNIIIGSSNNSNISSTTTTTMSHNNNDQTATTSTSNCSSVAETQVATDSTTNTTSSEEEILKEFMRVQGALTLLANCIQEAALVVQLDLLETISKLLYNNQKNQMEFRNMDGYSILIHLFDNSHDFASQEGGDFLDSCFCLIFAIILDGSKSKRVMNIDALEFLFNVLSNSAQTEVRLQTLTCIQDLISINPLNIVSIRQVGAIDKLFQLVLDVHQRDKDNVDVSQDDNEVKESTKLLLATSELILYLGVLFSKHNTDVFRKYVELIKMTTLSDTLQVLLLSSSITLLSDTIYHQTLVEQHLLSTFIDVILRYQREVVTLQSEQQQLDDDKKQPMTEKVLLVFELIIMYIKYSDDASKEFYSKIGDRIKMFVMFITMPDDDEVFQGSDVSDLCMWIVNAIVAMEHYPHQSVSVLVSLLDDQSLSANKKEKLCYCLADMMRNLLPEQRSLKIRFQECGGMNALFAIAKNTRSPHSLVYAALVALCEVCHGCEENKCVLDSSGYMALSAAVKSTHVVIDEYLFQMFVELAMNNNVVIRYDQNYLEHNFSHRVNHIIENIIEPQPQYTSILPYSRRQIDLFSSKSLKQLTSGNAGTGNKSLGGIESTQPTTELYGDEINLGEDDEFTKDSPVSSPSSTPIHSLSGSLNGNQMMNTHHLQSNVHSHSAQSLPQVHLPMLGRPHTQLSLLANHSKTTGIVRVPSFRNLFSGTRRNSIGSWAGSFDDLYEVCQSFNETNSLTEASQIGNRRSTLIKMRTGVDDDKETLYSYTLLGRSKLRSPDAALMLIDLLPQSPTHIQQHNLILLMKILESNPQNKKMLCAAQGLKFLLYLSHQAPEETQSYFSRLIVILGLYDISPSEVRLLFDLACFPAFESHPQLAQHQQHYTSTPPLSHNPINSSSGSGSSSSGNNFGESNSSTPYSTQKRERNKKHELQMQVLYVIGTLTERKAPPLYFNFDGFDSYISVGTIDKFPSQRSGYTFSCWIKTNYFLSDEAGLFSWQDASDNNIFDVYFKAMGRHADSKRYLCMQTRNYPSPPETFFFDKFSFSECGSWHHIVITHSKQRISLFVDGKFIQNYSTANYPKVITKDKPIQGCIGRRLYTSLPNNNSNNNSFSNLSQLVSQASQSSFNSLSSIDPDSFTNAPTSSTPQSEKGFFCGQMGTIHFFEGIWEAPSCLKVFSRGNLYNNSYKPLGIESKEFLVIKPASSPSNVIEPIANPITSSALSMSGDVFLAPPPPVQIPAVLSPPSSPPITRNLSFQGQLPGQTSASGSNISPSQNNSFLLAQDLQSTSTPPSSGSGREGNVLVNSGDHVLQVPKEETSLLKKSMSILVPIETQGAVIEFIGVNVHQTRCLKDVIKEVGGIHLCLPFLDMAPAQQVAGLRILAGLLHKSDSNKAQFRELSGFAILYHLLLRFSSHSTNPALSTELTMETFEILFDLLLDGMNNLSDTKQLWSHDCINLILDLLPSCTEELQLHVLKYFNNLLNNTSYDTLRLWITNTGGEGASKINHLLTLSLKLESESVFLYNILKKTLPHMAIDDVESIFEYMLFNNNGVYEKIHTKSKILDIVYEEMRKCPSLLEHLRSLGGFNIVFSMIEIPNEEIRVTAIKMIGLLMHSNSKAASLFRRNSGFDLLAVMLSRYPPSLAVCRALTVLMVDGYRFDPKCVSETKQRSSSWISLDFFTRDKSSDALSAMANKDANRDTSKDSSVSDDSSSDHVDDMQGMENRGDGRTIVYPEALHTVIMLLYNLPNQQQQQQQQQQDVEAIRNVQYQSLVEIEKILDNMNMEILWNQSWFEWLYQFIENQGFQLTKENKVYKQTLSICKKMLIHDVVKKTSKIIKVKEVCIDLEEFYVHIMDSVLDYIERDFVLATNEANDIIKNLVLYFKTLEDIAVPPVTSMRILNSINQLAFHNTPSIRASMKSNGLFDLRDTLIIQLLRCDIKGVIMTFDFECVVDQKAFREANNGLLYLLYFFHISVNDPQLQYDICAILKNVFGSSEENRKIISNILEDATVIHLFFDNNNMSQHSPVAGHHNNDDIENNDPITYFIESYYREEFTPKRIEIETRIGKLLAPVETKFNSQQEKLVKSKEKRIKQRKDKISKQQSTIQKLVQETEEKRKIRANKMQTQYTSRSKQMPIHSEERLKLGKERWDYFKQKLWDSVLWINNNDNGGVTTQSSSSSSPSKSILPYTSLIPNESNNSTTTMPTTTTTNTTSTNSNNNNSRQPQPTEQPNTAV
ncbi:hypothetical protein SAMD00019534_089000 [Acytostelium subglobosum LB1]|uniref:hypothetical protein n=1 Tax=Acytostelium subglobosum LB1 TaxID=1410327 RepID=UPI0006449083|nr:hypothetical protein SAMD00019534_089000 [Acytostelium subglobosum LB1]GAM25725.1 hypothetical protein SAMD00019534_089000 [Acytostelium subglobosum LB1]|eukprot:XP_012751243.1 hypothetical protein SAMD00019534_089000 [Acytostelium subglobosum LB1]